MLKIDMYLGEKDYVRDGNSNCSQCEECAPDKVIGIQNACMKKDCKCHTPNQTKCCSKCSGDFDGKGCTMNNSCPCHTQQEGWEERLNELISPKAIDYVDVAAFQFLISSLLTEQKKRMVEMVEEQKFTDADLMTFTKEARYFGEYHNNLLNRTITKLKDI